MKADLLKGAHVAPVPEVLPNQIPGREVNGQHPPLATRLFDVEDRVENLTFAVGAGTTAFGAIMWRQEWFDGCPLSIR